MSIERQIKKKNMRKHLSPPFICIFFQFTSHGSTGLIILKSLTIMALSGIAALALDAPKIS
jgi:hypothetical protein